MKMKKAIDALDALAHETRLQTFRLLVRAGPGGLPAGRIAGRLKVHAATLSHHLGLLERAGLLTARREARQIYYAANYAGMRGLLDYLAEDCCKGLSAEAGAPTARQEITKEISV